MCFESFQFSSPGDGGPSNSTSTSGCGPPCFFSNSSFVTGGPTTSTPPVRSGSFGAFGHLPSTSGLRRPSTTVLVCPTRHVVEEIERVQIFTMIRSRWLHLEI